MEVPSIYLNRLLSETARKKAVSLHLTVGSQPVWRLGMELGLVPEADIVTSDLLAKLLPIILTEAEQASLASQRELVVVKTFAEMFRFRINVFYQKNLLSITFYYIAETIGSFTDLNLPPIFNDLARLRSGLLLVAGTYGTGKTTTAASLIEQINQTRKARIVTLERPIEYVFTSRQSVVEQRQVGQDTVSFVTGLQYCLEEDVDVVYVGEMRQDFDQAVPYLLELAAGNTLVVAEVSASSSAKAVGRIMTGAFAAGLNEEVARHSLADALAVAVTQRLLPRRGGGLIPAAEVLLGNQAVKPLLREGKLFQLESVIQTSRKEGMISLANAVDDLVRLGEVKAEDINLHQ